MSDIDVGAISEALNNKADRDINNLTASGYTKGSSLGMPSSRYTDLTLGASGTTYTAPANGWLCCILNINSGYVEATADDGIRKAYWYGSGWVGGLFCLRKNETFKVYYSNYTSTVDFRFIYAEGEPSS